MMASLIEHLQEALDNQLIRQMEMADLKETATLLDQLGKEIKNRSAELNAPPAEEDDPDYINLIINGQRDRIKRDIEQLNISCNEFSHLPDEIYQLKNLKKLFLYNNKFSVEEKRFIRKQFNSNVQIFF